MSSCDNCRNSYMCKYEPIKRDIENKNVILRDNGLWAEVRCKHWEEKGRS